MVEDRPVYFCLSFQSGKLTTELCWRYLALCVDVSLNETDNAFVFCEAAERHLDLRLTCRDIQNVVVVGKLVY